MRNGRENINKVSQRGERLDSLQDKTDNLARKREPENSTRIEAEVDRIFLNTGETLEVQDTRLNRTILVEKSGSASSVERIASA